MSPEVSVIMPVHHAGPFLGEALDSLAAQTVEDWELVAVQDGVDEADAQRLAAFGEQAGQPVRVLLNTEPEGVSATRNRALEVAQGRVIAFLDADDRWDQNHLQTLLEVVANGADVAYAGARWIDALGYSLGTVSTPPDYLDLASIFPQNPLQSMSTVAVRADALHPQRFITHLRYGEDSALVIELLFAGKKARASGHETVDYRRHGKSAMSQTLARAEGERAFARHFFGEERLPMALRRRCRTEACLSVGRLQWRTHPAHARAAFAEAWRTSPWRFDAPLRALLTFVPGLDRPD